MPVIKKSKAQNKTKQKETTEDQSKLPLFEFHGLTFVTTTDGQERSSCPFCGKANHFYVKPQTGQWDCKRCSKKGNVYTFLSLLYSHAVSSVTEADLKSLAKARRLPLAAFKGNGIIPGYDASQGRWYFPVFSSEKPDTLVGLRVWDGPTKPVFSTTGTQTHLLNGHRFLTSNDTTAYVCEGDWDLVALEWLRVTCKQPGIVTGVPGSSSFKEKWLERFKGKEVILLYDNDEAGKIGQLKAARMLKGVAKSIKVILWPSVTAEKYDLNDFVADRVRKPKEAWKELQGMLVDFVDTEASVEPAEGTTIDNRRPEPKVYDRIPKIQEIIKTYSKNFHTDKNTRDTLAIMLATALSIKITGDPLWLFIIGPPGAGKTLMINSLFDSELCHFESNLSPHTLISGWRMDNPDDDPSLIPVLVDRCLILKDYTEIRSKSRQEQDEIYGVLRGAFDGTAQRTFANGQVRRYDNTHFTIIAGTTHEIHGDNRASLGERFVKCEFLGDFHNAEEHIRAAIAGMDKLASKEKELRDLVAAFLSQPIPKALPKIPEWIKDRIIAIAQIVAFLRASVDYSHGGDLNYRPRAEVGTRLAKQLIKLSQSLAIIFKLRSVDKECYRLIEKIAFDTATGFHLDLLRVLMTAYPSPMLKEDIAKAAHLAPTTADKKLGALLELKAIKRERTKPTVPSTNGKLHKRAGQPAYGYLVSSHVAKLWQQAKIETK